MAGAARRVGGGNSGESDETPHGQDRSRFLFLPLQVRLRHRRYSTLDVNIQNNLHRDLCSLGWVCAYNGDDMSMSETLSLACDGDENLVSPPNLSLSNCGVACFKLFKLMLSKSDAPTRCSAVRALSGLFTGLPRMMLKAQEIGMIEEILDPNNEFEVSARPRASAAPPPHQSNSTPKKSHD